MMNDTPSKIRRAAREAKARELEEGGVILNLMSSPSGRAYIFNLLERTHIFHTTFSGDPYRSAFAEGERNVGLQLLSHIQMWAPDQYIQMIREANDRDNANRPSRDQPNGGRDLSATGDDSTPIDPRTEWDYDPLSAED